VLEREPLFYGNARAVYTDDECMRIFQSIDLADDLAQDMLQDAVVQMVLPDGDVLMQISDTRRPYGWPANNFFYQPFLETKIAEALNRYPTVTVQRGREVTQFDQDTDGVTVHHAATQGMQYGKTNATATITAARPQTDANDTGSVRAKYFVACDGGRSTIRPLLGIEMTGQSFPNPWLVVDIKAKDPNDGLNHVPYFNFICDPSCPTVSCVQPKGHHRFEFMLMPGQTKEYMEDPATIRSLLSRHVDVDKFDILRSLVYTFNALIAEKWRVGRVILCGDSGHMTPQFIGQGMNAGVRDAYNLAWKLDAVLKGHGGEKLLDTYQSERRPHVNDMIMTAVDMKNFVSEANPVKAFLRNTMTRLALATPVLGDFVRRGDFIPQPEYKPGTFFGLERKAKRGPEGRLLPQPSVRCGDGKQRLLDAVLGNGYAIVGLGVDPRTALGAAEINTWKSLGAQFVAAYPMGARPQGAIDRRTPKGLVVVEDLHGELLKWMKQHGKYPGSVAVVRPDHVVFGVVHANELANATHALVEQLQVSALLSTEAA
jgi:3-(3-hydroxy-phenyl)propionate hydroxylase